MVGAMVALYFLVPPSPVKRRLKRMAIACMPLLVIYVAVGWGRPEKVFKPLQSLSSVSSKPDSSTLARNVENLSLIATANYSSGVMGTGWGHKYVELSNKYTIADAMELWQYVPHNSILGLLGFTGFLGVLGFWMMFPVTIFLLARTALQAQDPRARSVGLVGVMSTIACLNQMFGDMGIFSWITMYFLSMVWGAALRVPAESGAWPSARSQAQAVVREEPAVPEAAASG
jgi:O-antigen ligase